MNKRSSIFMLAAMLASTPVMAQTPPVNPPAATTQAESYKPVTLATWGRLSKRERQVAIIAAVEGLLLASAAPNNPPQFGAQCLLNETPEELEKKMRQVLPQFENEAFVDVFLALTGCLNNPAPRP